MSNTNRLSDLWISTNPIILIEFYKKNSSPVSSKKIRFFAVLLITILLSLKTFAVVYNVTVTTDGNALNQLRGAIVAADGAGPGPHTINVAAGTYTLTLGTIIFGNNPQTISIVGAGSATTIISMTGGATRDRIFLINPVATTNSPVISISGITFQNAYLTSDAYGGGAIYSGGGTAESLTLTNCAFLNNTIPAGNGGGAAVKIDPRGNLTVNNCTFTNNVSNDADGGAILFIIYGSGVGAGYGTLSITNSTFTGNSVNLPGAGTSNGGALAISGQGGVTPFTTTITNNTFINNTTDGLGGAIVVNNGPAVSTLQINFNRFLGNTAAAGGASNALHFVESSGSVNADNNWWGCNTGPAAGPCDRAGGDVAGGGALILTKWLQLKTTALPTTICNTGTNSTTVTASFLSNSASEAVTAANISRLIGLPVTWGPTTNGSLSGSQTTIQASGTATSTFTSNGTGGVTATVNAQVDNVPSGETTPSRANITVNKASIAPTGISGTTTICSGSSTTLTATGGTLGTGANFQWGTGAVVGTSPLVGQTASTLTVSPTTNTTYWVRIENTSAPCSTTPTSGVTQLVTVNQPSISPTGISGTTTICNGSSTTLTATGGTLGTGANYQWGSGAVVGTSPLAGQTASTLTVSPGSNTTYWVRIENTTAPCTANTGGVVQLVTVNQPSAAPTSISGTTTICNGSSTTLTAAGGTLGTGANYQWGTGAVVGTSPLAGQTASTLTVSPTTNTTYWVRIENTAAPCTATTGGVTKVVTVISTNTWTGVTSNNWFTATNWSCNLVPTAVLDVVIPSGTPNPCVIPSGTAQVRSLTINTGASLTNQGTINING